MCGASSPPSPDSLLAAAASASASPLSSIFSTALFSFLVAACLLACSGVGTLRSRLPGAGSGRASGVAGVGLCSRCSGIVSGLTLDGGHPTVTPLATVDHPSSFGVDAAGEAYVLSLDGAVYRIDSA